MSFNRPPAPPERVDASRRRPDLWAEGSQRPRLDLRAFARVSLVLSRRTGRTMLLWAVRLLTAGAQGMAENTLGPRLARMGRLGRNLPTRDGVATGLRGVAGLLRAAADIAVPPPAPVKDPAFADLLRGTTGVQTALRPRRVAQRLPDPDAAVVSAPEPAPQPAPQFSPQFPPQPVVRTAQNQDFDAPTLAAIRAMIDDMPGAAPIVPCAPEPAPPPSGRVLLTHAVPLSPPEPRTPTIRDMVANATWRAAATAIACTATLLTLPVGVTKALLTHLNGEDLRTWS